MQILEFYWCCIVRDAMSDVGKPFRLHMLFFQKERCHTHCTKRIGADVKLLAMLL